MQTIIENASTTFTDTIGFNWGEVVTYVVDQGKLIAGTVLGLIVEILPILLVLFAIGFVVGLIWKFFHVSRH